MALMNTIKYSDGDHRPDNVEFIRVVVNVQFWVKFRTAKIIKSRPTHDLF